MCGRMATLRGDTVVDRYMRDAGTDRVNRVSVHTTPRFLPCRRNRLHSGIFDRRKRNGGPFIRDWRSPGDMNTDYTS